MGWEFVMTLTMVGRRSGPLPRLRLSRWPGRTLMASAALVGPSVLWFGVLTPQIAGATTPTVTNCANSGAGSLRQAVLGAQAGDSISFALSPACSYIALSGPIALTASVSLNGPGPGALAVDQTAHQAVFAVGAGVKATIAGLTIENGATGITNAGTLTLSASTVAGNGSSTGGGIVNTGTLTVTNSTLSKNGADVPDEGGGAIDNDGGTVTISGSTFEDNTASDGANGGAIFTNGGAVSIAGSTFTDNSAGHGNGGGLYNEGGSVTVTTTTWGNNSAVAGTGGGIDNDSGTLKVLDSTFGRDSADYSSGGGAIDNNAAMSVADSTFYGNDATFGGEGGAILNSGTAAVTASTLTHNKADHIGGALYGPMTVTASILALNPQGGNCAQAMIDGGDNLDDDGTCGFTAATDISRVEADLAPGGLADNGGPTKTIALEADSPAAHAVASSTLCAVPDQRGVARPTPCAMGAVELVLAPQAITSANHASAKTSTPFSFEITTTGAPLPRLSKKGSLPKGLKLVNNGNGTATIAGTPAKAGVYVVDLKSTYGKGGTKVVVSQTFTLTVRSSS
ncbi:MAG: choice-of-anchor Q domain-containing protein [Acidimicrobiales bacterium]